MNKSSRDHTRDQPINHQTTVQGNTSSNGLSSLNGDQCLAENSGGVPPGYTNNALADYEHYVPPRTFPNQSAFHPPVYERIPAPHNYGNAFTSPATQQQQQQQQPSLSAPSNTLSAPPSGLNPNSNSNFNIYSFILPKTPLQELNELCQKLRVERPKAHITEFPMKPKHERYECQYCWDTNVFTGTGHSKKEAAHLAAIQLRDFILENYEIPPSRHDLKRQEQAERRRIRARAKQNHIPLQYPSTTGQSLLTHPKQQTSLLQHVTRTEEESKSGIYMHPNANRGLKMEHNVTPGKVENLGLSSSLSSMNDDNHDPFKLSNFPSFASVVSGSSTKKSPLAPSSVAALALKEADIQESMMAAKGKEKESDEIMGANGAMTPHHHTSQFEYNLLFGLDLQLNDLVKEDTDAKQKQEQFGHHEQFPKMKD